MISVTDSSTAQLLTVAKENGVATSPGHSFLAIFLKLWIRFNTQFSIILSTDAIGSAFSAIIGAFTITLLYSTAEEGNVLIFLK